MVVTVTLVRLVVATAMFMTVEVISQDEIMEDMESMMSPAGNEMGSENTKAGKVKQLSAIQQTSLALQQLGIVVGVAFMVAFLFMVMIGLEKLWDKMEASYQTMMGKPPAPEVDPAAMVGTFSRYKN